MGIHIGHGAVKGFAGAVLAGGVAIALTGAVVSWSALPDGIGAAGLWGASGGRVASAPASVTVQSPAADEQSPAANSLGCLMPSGTVATAHGKPSSCLTSVSRSRAGVAAAQAARGQFEQQQGAAVQAVAQSRTTAASVVAQLQGKVMDNATLTALTDSLSAQDSKNWDGWTLEDLAAAKDQLNTQVEAAQASHTAWDQEQQRLAAERAAAQAEAQRQAAAAARRQAAAQSSQSTSSGSSSRRQSGSSQRSSQAQSGSGSNRAQSQGQAPAQPQAQPQPQAQAAPGADFSAQVSLSGGQAQIDRCAGPVLFAGSVIAQHNYCGGAWMLRVSAGETVRLSGLVSGLFQAVSVRVLPKGSTTADLAGMGGSGYYLQTCTYSGQLRLVALSRIG